MATQLLSTESTEATAPTEATEATETIAVTDTIVKLDLSFDTHNKSKASGRRMLDLYGSYDSNLALLEKHFAVTIAARGAQVQIVGESASARAVRDILQTLHSRLLAQQPIDSGVIESLIALAKPTTAPAPPISASLSHISADTNTKTIGKTMQTADPLDIEHISNLIITTRRKQIAPRSPMQRRYMQALRSHDITFALGPAGTGKTYIAVAQAVADYMSGKVERLILSRPAVEAGEQLGFLPGDMKDKIDPYLRPLYDALYDCLPANQVERRIAAGEIEIAPLAFMRGRTLANAFIILDEAQNCSIPQMKMFLTRFGPNSRMAVCGDPSQVDLPTSARSGLIDAVAHLEAIDDIATVRFGASDVVRHPLVGQIVAAYESNESNDSKDSKGDDTTETTAL